MISGNMIKPNYQDAIQAWVDSGNKITKVNGFTQKIHKNYMAPQPKTRHKQALPPLSQANADKLHAWLLIQDGRLTKLATFLDTTTQTVRRISDRQAPCPPSKWRNIVKFMDSYK